MFHQLLSVHTCHALFGFPVWQEPVSWLWKRRAIWYTIFIIMALLFLYVEYSLYLWSILGRIHYPGRKKLCYHWIRPYFHSSVDLDHSLENMGSIKFTHNLQLACEQVPSWNILESIEWLTKHVTVIPIHTSKFPSSVQCKLSIMHRCLYYRLCWIQLFFDKSSCQY